MTTPLDRSFRWMAGKNPVPVGFKEFDGLRVRSHAVTGGSANLALGGAVQTVSAFDAFRFGIAKGRGCIRVAMVVFACRKPSKANLVSPPFAQFDAQRASARPAAGANKQFFLALPYILGILTMIFMTRRAFCPRVLLKPLRHGDRIWRHLERN